MPSGWRSTDHSCVNASAQYAGIAALTGPREPVATHGRGVCRTARLYHPGAERAAAASAAPPRAERSMRSPTSAALGFDSRTLQSRLLDEAGIATIAGTSFGASRRGSSAIFLCREHGRTEGGHRPDRRLAGQPETGRHSLGGPGQARGPTAAATSPGRENRGPRPPSLANCASAAHAGERPGSIGAL